MNKNLSLTWVFIFVFGLFGGESRAGSEEAGDILQLLIPAVALGATLYKKDYEGTWQFVKAGAASQLTTELLKELIHKERPNGKDYKSFPSGHTMSAFHGASFIHERYGWKYAIPAYIGASFVGYSRVDADEHHIEDVLAGALIGILGNKIFTTPYEDVTIEPYAKNGVIGYGVKIKW